MFFQFIRVYNMPSRTQQGELPYREHPLYGLRIASIVTAVLGCILSGIAILGVYFRRNDSTPTFVLSAFLLFVSFCVVLNDLIKYAAAKASLGLPQNSSLEMIDISSWPSKLLVIADFILAVLFQWLFWVEFVVIISGQRYSYYPDASGTFEAYANLANLAASILHGIAFWKELIARKKIAWQKTLIATPCQNCGHAKQTSLPQPEEAEPSSPLSSKITIPKWARGAATVPQDDDVEAGPSAQEPLLATPEGSLTEVGAGYGTLAQSVESISSVPETVVKQKDKGKKRVVEAE